MLGNVLLAALALVGICLAVQHRRGNNLNRALSYFDINTVEYERTQQSNTHHTYVANLLLEATKDRARDILNLLDREGGENPHWNSVRTALKNIIGKHPYDDKSAGPSELFYLYEFVVPKHIELPPDLRQELDDWAEFNDNVARWLPVLTRSNPVRWTTAQVLFAPATRLVQAT